MMLPAYGRILAKMRRQGFMPASQAVTVRLDTWPPKDHPKFPALPQVTVPPTTDVDALDTHFLEGLDVQIAYWPSHTARERLYGLCEVILSANPRRLWWVNIEHPDGFHFVKSVELGEEVEPNDG